MGQENNRIHRTCMAYLLLTIDTQMHVFVSLAVKFMDNGSAD